MITNSLTHPDGKQKMCPRLTEVQYIWAGALRRYNSSSTGKFSFDSTLRWECTVPQRIEATRHSMFYSRTLFNKGNTCIHRNLNFAPHHMNNSIHAHRATFILLPAFVGLLGFKSDKVSVHFAFSLQSNDILHIKWCQKRQEIRVLDSVVCTAAFCEEVLWTRRMII